MGSFGGSVSKNKHIGLHFLNIHPSAQYYHIWTFVKKFCVDTVSPVAKLH